jgi:hypothetical protein
MDNGNTNRTAMKRRIGSAAVAPRYLNRMLRLNNSGLRTTMPAEARQN